MDTNGNAELRQRVASLEAALLQLAERVKDHEDALQALSEQLRRMQRRDTERAIDAGFDALVLPSDHGPAPDQR